MQFHDRADAGRKLAKRLAKERWSGPVFLFALPRGGVATGAEIAKAMRLPLDVIVTRKLGAPHNPEYAVGSLAETGEVLWNPDEKRHLTKEQQQTVVDDETREMRRRIKTYRNGRPLRSLKGATALIIDDGIATGFTMRAAIAAARHQGAKEIVIAVPHGAKDTLTALRDEGCRVIALTEPALYGAVGAYYDVFPQTTDDQVITFLKDTSSV